MKQITSVTFFPRVDENYQLVGAFDIGELNPADVEQTLRRKLDMDVLLSAHEASYQLHFNGTRGRIEMLLREREDADGDFFLGAFGLAGRIFGACREAGLIGRIEELRWRMSDGRDVVPPGS